MLSNQAVISNTFQPNKPVFEQNPKKITGFDLERIIELSPFPSRVGRLLKFACNLAASTSEFVIYKSQKTLAEDAGCSVSTLQRAYRVAVAMGVLSVTPVYDDKTRARKANMYRFTPKALTFVRDCLKLLRDAKLKISSSQKTVRGIVAKAFALFDFTPTTPCQNEETPPCQNDVQEIRDLSKTRKTLQGGVDFVDNEKPKKAVQQTSVISQSEVIAKLAAAKSRANNERLAEKHDSQRSTLDKLFGRFGYKPKRNPARNLPCADIVPDYSVVPVGFRGGDEPAGDSANATATLSVRKIPDQA